MKNQLIFVHARKALLLKSPLLNKDSLSSGEIAKLVHIELEAKEKFKRRAFIPQ